MGGEALVCMLGLKLGKIIVIKLSYRCQTH